MIIDISPLISPRIGVFPGDVGFERKISHDFNSGDSLLLSSIRTTLHVGAHADAPNHYTANGESIAERDLALYLGRCWVVHAHAPQGARVGLEHLAPQWRDRSEWPAERILVRTGSFRDPDRWNSDFCSLDPSLIDLWAAAGVRLIGIDTPSIDPEDSQELQAHQVIAKNNMAILEGLVLDGVAEGLYTLIALPLKLAEADAAPVRAVLIENPDLFPR